MPGPGLMEINGVAGGPILIKESMGVLASIMEEFGLLVSATNWAVQYFASPATWLIFTNPDTASTVMIWFGDVPGEPTCMQPVASAGQKVLWVIRLSIQLTMAP